MWVSQITEEMLTKDLIDRLLFQDLADTGEKVDCDGRARKVFDDLLLNQ